MTDDKRKVEEFKEVVAKDYNTSVGNGDPTNPLNESDAVTIQPPPKEPDSEPEVKLVDQEVEYSEMVQGEPAFQEQDSDGKTKEDYTKEMMELVGSDLDTVKSYMEELKRKAVISDFILMPMGALGTFDQVPGRVRVHYSVDKTVLDITLG